MNDSLNRLISSRPILSKWWQDNKAKLIKNVSNGHSSRVYLISTEQGEAILKFSVKVGNNINDTTRLLSKIESPFYPSLIAYQDNEAWVITSVTPGKPLQKLLSGPDEFRDIDKENIVVEAIQSLKVLHNMPIMGWGWLKREEFSGRVATVSEYYLRQPRQFALENLDRLSLNKQVFDQISHQFAQHYKDSQPVLSHGDFWGTHIMVDNNKFSGIIDFDSAKGAIPEHDLLYFSARHPQFTQLAKSLATNLDSDLFHAARIIVCFRHLFSLLNGYQKYIPHHRFWQVIDADCREL